jgi:hypothetical protein
MEEKTDTPPPPRKRGRPRKYATAAERQAAYRERLRQQGVREVRRLLPTHPEPLLRSALIDLSALPPWKRG